MFSETLCVLTLGFAVFSATSGSAFALDRHVHIHNNTSVVMNEFYASNVGTRDYEENILHGDVIEAGDSWDINIDDGTGYCRYDFMAVFDDGSKAKKNSVNVCEVSDFYFDD